MDDFAWNEAADVLRLVQANMFLLLDLRGLALLCRGRRLLVLLLRYRQCVVLLMSSMVTLPITSRVEPLQVVPRFDLIGIVIVRRLWRVMLWRTLVSMDLSIWLLRHLLLLLRVWSLLWWLTCT